MLLDTCATTMDFKNATSQVFASKALYGVLLTCASTKETLAVKHHLPHFLSCSSVIRCISEMPCFPRPLIEFAIDYDAPIPLIIWASIEC